MADAPAPVPPLLTRAFGLLTFAHFLQALGYASMLLLPLYLQQLRASRTEIGLVMATAGASGLVARPFVGWLLDTVGRRPALIGGTVIMVASMVLIGLIDEVGILIYVQRAVFGVGFAILFTGYFAFAADIVPAERRTQGLALFGVAGLVPLVVNPAFDQTGLAAAELRWFLPVVGLCVLPSLLPLWLLRERATEQRERFQVGAVLAALRRRPLWPVWLATLLLAAMVASFMTFAAVTAEARGVERPATLWLSYAAAAAGVRLFGGRWPDRLGPAKLIAPAIGLYVAAAFYLAQATSLEQFLVVGGLAGLAHGLGFPALISQVVERTRAEFRGSGLAGFTALWAVSELAITPVLGWVADRWSDGVMFVVLGLAALAGLALWLLLERLHGVPRSGGD